GRCVRRRRGGAADRPRHGWRRGRRVTEGVIELQEGARGDGDARAVDAPGGHVRQSRAWAAHRGSQGWRARFLAIGDVRALALTRSWPVVGGGAAYLPRGPVVAGEPWMPDGSAAAGAIGTALAAASGHPGADAIELR